MGRGNDCGISGLSSCSEGASKRFETSKRCVAASEPHCISITSAVDWGGMLSDADAAACWFRCRITESYKMHVVTPMPQHPQAHPPTTTAIKITSARERVLDQPEVQSGLVVVEAKEVGVVAGATASCCDARRDRRGRGSPVPVYVTLAEAVVSVLLAVTEISVALIGVVSVSLEIEIINASVVLVDLVNVCRVVVLLEVLAGQLTQHCEGYEASKSQTMSEHHHGSVQPSGPTESATAGVVDVVQLAEVALVVETASSQ